MKRFRAVIDKAGVNAFVTIPPRVSEAFRPHARSGRVRVEGSLNRSAFQATLVPVAGGGHRLFVNEAMRRRAGVSVEEEVRLSMTLASWTIETPADIRAHLETRPDALAAFEKLAPSRRRELIRYIDDARTPETRSRRIASAADHVLGKAAARATGRGRKSTRLWECPRCGNAFVNKNQYHSCKRYRLEDVFRGKPRWVRELFDRYRAMVERIARKRGRAVRIVPYRDRVGFMVRVRFAGATPKARWLDVSFWLTRRLEHERFRRVETLAPDVHVHSVRLTKVEEVDRELETWLGEAYAVGCQDHLD